MNLPHLPSKFSSGETLTAAKLNALVDWMRDVARLLPGLQVNTGRGLIYSRSSAGTTVSLAHGYIQGSDSGEDAAAVPAARPRRLFAWSTETGGDAERPTWIVRVTDGLALVRPNQASAPEPCVAGVILGAGAGTVNVGIAKTELSFTPKKEAVINYHLSVINYQLKMNIICLTFTCARDAERAAFHQKFLPENWRKIWCVEPKDALLPVPAGTEKLVRAFPRGAS